MGRPVIHFEVVGKDGAKLRSFYSEVFDWEMSEIGGPMDYSVTPREGNTAADGGGIGGGIGGSSEYDGHVTFYVEVPEMEAAFTEIESRGGRRLDGPDEVPGQGILIGHFADPEGHMIGLVSPTG